MKEKKDKVFLGLIIIFFTVFTLGIAVISLRSPISQRLRASTSIPSANKSFAVAMPQVALIPGNTKGSPPTSVKLSVVIRDETGNLLQNRNVKISTNLPGVKISPSESQNTNEIGQALFFISSDNVGIAKFNIVETSSSISLINVPSIEFTQ